MRAKAPATRSAGSSRNKGSALRLRELLQTRQVLDEQLLGRIEVAEADRSRSGVAGSPTPCTPSRSPLTGRQRRQPPDRQGKQLHRRARHRPVPHDNTGFRPGLRVFVQPLRRIQLLGSVHGRSRGRAADRTSSVGYIAGLIAGFVIVAVAIATPFLIPEQPRPDGDSVRYLSTWVRAPPRW